MSAMGWFSKTLWLVADDPDGSWWCKCRLGIVDALPHRKETSPTGGTGWLWFCSTCGLAFMFARCVRISGTLDQIAQKRTPRTEEVLEMSGKITKSVLLATPSDWLDSIQPILSSIKEGERYVFFDGIALPAKHGPVKFDGMIRSHDLPDLPHLSESLMLETIANAEYWNVS
jgi:hypothetical protein